MQYQGFPFTAIGVERLLRLGLKMLALICRTKLADGFSLHCLSPFTPISGAFASEPDASASEPDASDSGSFASESDASDSGAFASESDASAFASDLRRLHL
ncbi:unnamed protein product [Linum trigynum]|uniref:Uncharacterized protein n=1 Tax=Linum trigynum TaxID=586398 RepID=A0AAV2GLJ5_9ROSI